MRQQTTSSVFYQHIVLVRFGKPGPDNSSVPAEQCPSIPSQPGIPDLEETKPQLSFWPYVLLLFYLLYIPDHVGKHVLSANIVTLLHVWLCDSMDYSLPGSSVHEISQSRILEWIAVSFPSRSSWPRDGICASCIGRQILYLCTGKPWPFSLRAIPWYQKSSLSLVFTRTFVENLHQLNN